jgi:hypothetical protein
LIPGYRNGDEDALGQALLARKLAAGTVTPVSAWIPRSHSDRESRLRWFRVVRAAGI